MLSALNWKRLPVYVLPTISSSTINGVLNGIFDVLNTGSYYDGSIRTTGSNSAWRFFRSINGVTTEAVYGYPPTITSMSQSVIFAGVSTLGQLPKLAPGSISVAANLANTLLLGTAINAGNIVHWTSASVFTTGSNSTVASASSFTGYGILSSTAPSTARTARIYAWECQEAVALQLVESSSVGGGAFCGIAGGFIDPESSASLDSFPDGRIYGVATSAVTASVIFLNLTTDFLNHVNNTAVTNVPKFAYLTPYAIRPTASVSTLQSVELRNINFNFSSSSTRTPAINCYIRDQNYSFVIGRLREIKATRSLQSGLTYRSGSLDLAYTFSSRDSASLSVATTGSTLFLMA